MMWLAHSLTRGLDLNDPQTKLLRWHIIMEKPFPCELCREWYSAITQALPNGSGSMVELGSGSGFLSDYIPDLITSEIFQCKGIRAVLDSHFLPFLQDRLRTIVMTDVFYHFPLPGNLSIRWPDVCGEAGC
jgi:hypothetical protein